MMNHLVPATLVAISVLGCSPVIRESTAPTTKAHDRTSLIKTAEQEVTAVGFLEGQSMFRRFEAASHQRLGADSDEAELRRITLNVVPADRIAQNSIDRAQWGYSEVRWEDRNTAFVSMYLHWRTSRYDSRSVQFLTFFERDRESWRFRGWHIASYGAVSH